jgi:hypothetical protein
MKQRQSDDPTNNYLPFQPMSICFIRFCWRNISLFLCYTDSIRSASEKIFDFRFVYMSLNFNLDKPPGRHAHQTSLLAYYKA